MSKQSIIKFKESPSFISAATVVGNKESKGPLGSYFDYHDPTDKFGQSTWEQAESEMQRLSCNIAMAKAKLTPDDLDAIFAGDLINQCTSSSFGLLDFDVPYYGLYGACSTAAEGLILSSIAYNGSGYKKICVVVSSHNCSAERQFRFPIEYGGQRTPTSQWTVTAAAAFILGDGNGAYITEALPGRSIDSGIKDANNMGAAMAPAAVDTLVRYFRESGMQPSDFDMILTGDLGEVGHKIVEELTFKEGYDISQNYKDCGLMIYDCKSQDMHAGGSGCGCSGSVLASFILDKFKKQSLRDILWIGTGALMSPMSTQQGQSIPGIAHLVRITKERNL